MTVKELQDKLAEAIASGTDPEGEVYIFMLDAGTTSRIQFYADATCIELEQV